LRAQGWSLARTLAFRDHYAFTRSDISSIAAAMKDTGAVLALTTEKDAVRFEACGALPFTLAAVPMAVVFDPQETIEGALLAALARGRSRPRQRLPGSGVNEGGRPLDEERP
ncbi:MAG: tetraacyldisaccharide 4'-kinase, partial [Acidobacteria bacterium]|nr:tetraacyldisaccharide 4'-kinase [Acidobacteriota bacterium]